MRLLAVFLTFAAVGCGNDSPDNTTSDGPPGPMVDGDTTCTDPAQALPQGWRPIDQVSSGGVTAGVATFEVDATAGGIDGFPQNPFTYVSLSGGTASKVDLTDVQARTSTAWDLALKRYVILINGGDSGPGGRRIAAVQAGSLAEVTSAPPESAFMADDWATEDCMLNMGPLGEPLTAVGVWYDIDTMTNVLTPKDLVYVLEGDGGARTKLRISTYYGDDANPMRGAVYEVEWAPL